MCLSFEVFTAVAVMLLLLSWDIVGDHGRASKVWNIFEAISYWEPESAGRKPFSWFVLLPWGSAIKFLLVTGGPGQIADVFQTMNDSLGW